MFEQLFKHPHALARQREGPLAEERRRYLVHCAEQQMASKTLIDIAAYLYAIATALRLAERDGEFISRDEIKAVADCWIRRHSHEPVQRTVTSSWRRFTRYATRWLSFLGRLKPQAIAPRPYADLVTRYAEQLLRESGLSPRTIDSRCYAIHDFLARIDGAGLRLDTLTVAEVDDVLARKFQQGVYSRATIRTYTDNLRVFFRYAEKCECCRAGLAAAIMSPRVYRDERIPAGPSWEDVKRLLATAEGSRPSEIRARAILLLLAVYGLRSGEVVGLRLEDFDWEREVLTVRRSKAQRPRTYPLCRLVGDAVLRYLREARPKSARREVFLLIRAPYGPLCYGGVGYVVRPRLRALGVNLPHHGPHTLRHACATHLVAQGLSLKEIGDHLGHQSPETTRIYAKVDLAGLRTVGEFDMEDLL